MPTAEEPGRHELVMLLQSGYRYALSLTHDRPRAEDLVQDAWTNVLAKGGPRHAGYLFAAIRNRFLDEARRLRLAPSEPLEEADVDAAAPPRDEEAIHVNRASMQQALARLSSDERESLYLFAVEGYALGEIARLTGRPEGTISSLVTRGRQKLRRLLSNPLRIAT
jgi:RNA polymerase sigma-70 factor (ECF subfamily)